MAERPPVSVVLAYCHPGLVQHEFMKSVLGVLASDERVVASIDTPGLYLPQLRNALAARFLELDCEWLWFVDSDIKFPPDALGRMLAYADKPGVFAGAYWSNYGGWVNITWLERHQGHYRPLPHLRASPLGVPELPDPPIAVDACGMGMTLIHREVLEKLAKVRAKDDWKWFGHDLENGVRLGEDVTFCRRAAHIGYPTLGVPVAVAHRKWALLGPAEPTP